MDEKQKLSKEQYAKLSDWGERVAILMFASLVIQQIVSGKPINSPSLVLGGVVAAFAYTLAYLWLKKSS